MLNTKILIIEDEIKLAQILKEYLQLKGHECLLVHDGKEALTVIKHYQPDLIVLDLNLPSLDGNEICKQARAQNHHMPILITTARIEENERITGLDTGADDYLCKPYAPKEVVARVQALLRRQQVYSQTSVMGGAPKLNEEQLMFSYQNTHIELTKVEFYLLKPMLEQPKRVYSRDQLMDNMYSDFHMVNDRTIDSHIKKIRTKFAQKWTDIQFIHSVYGVGYTFDVQKNA